MAEFDIDAYLGKEDKKKGFDIDAYLAQTPVATTARKEQGKAIASLADTALNTITGGLDMAAYPLARLYYGTVGGMSPEAAAAKAQAETTSPKDVVGRAFGYTGQPSYESSPIRQLGTYAGETLGENVIQPLAQTTGLPEPDVANMVNFASLGLAPAVPRVVKPVAGAVYDVGSGAFGAATGKIAAPGVKPQPFQQASARQPIGETYIPAPVLEQYRRGQITAEQASAAARPTVELGQNKLAATGGTVPFKGQGFRAFGEQLGETYQNPVNVLTDIGAGVLTGGPFLTGLRAANKAYQAYGTGQLSKAGFTPLTANEAAAFKMPGTPLTGPVTPTAPTPPPATLASLRQPQTPPPSPIPTPAATAQQAAAAQVAPPATPVQAAAQQTVAQRAQQALGENYRPPVAETPAPMAGPAVPEVPVVETAPRKLTLEELLAQAQSKRAGVFETAGEAPAAPLDIPTMRSTFANQIEQQRKNMMETREQNKATYAGTQATLGKEPTAKTPGERPSFTPPKSEIITADAALKDMIKNSGDVKSYKKNIVVNRNAYTDFAADAGVALDWTTAPDVGKMGVADARKAINKWVYDSIKTQAPELGLGVRGETTKTQMKRAGADIAFEQATKTPEQLAQEAANARAIIDRMNKMRGTGSRFEMMTVDETPSMPQIFKNEADFKQQKAFDIVAGKPTVGTWTEGSKTIHSQEIAPFLTKTHIYATDTATGKRVPRGADWTEADPKPSAVELAETLRGVAKRMEPGYDPNIPESTKIKRLQAATEEYFGPSETMKIDYEALNKAFEAKKKKGK